MNELALFAGAGGGVLGGKLLGWRTVCAVEIEPYPASVLLQRQNDGILPHFPIWDDICTFDGRPWRGIVDVVSGGFPCQDISAAGKGAGIDGERSGLWGEMARVVCEVRPRYVFVENSPMLTTRGLHRVLGDLAKMGYDAEWGVLGAHHAGAPHKRDRIWILAYSPEVRCNQRSNNAGKECDEIRRSEPAERSQMVAYPQQKRLERLGRNSGEPPQPESGDRGTLGNSDSTRKLQSERMFSDKWRWIGDTSWWVVEPGLGRVVNGVADRVDRLSAIGNGQVPAVVRKAWHVLCQRAANRS